MGSAFFGIPRDLTVLLAEAAGCSVFVETGTFRGETTRWASSHFARVETIEVFEKYYRTSREALSDCPNVVVHHGSSLDHLPSLIESFESDRALYWLDAHRTAESKCESQECPLLAELDLVQHRSGDIVMIDDARLFLAVPPSPADPAQWPTISEVLARLDLPGNRRFVQVLDDVIVAVPLDSPAATVLRDYAQSLVTRRLHEGGSLPRRVVRRLRSAVKGWPCRFESSIGTATTTTTVANGEPEGVK